MPPPRNSARPMTPSGRPCRNSPTSGGPSSKPPARRPGRRQAVLPRTTREPGPRRRTSGSHPVGSFATPSAFASEAPGRTRRTGRSARLPDGSSPLPGPRGFLPRPGAEPAAPLAEDGHAGSPAEPRLPAADAPWEGRPANDALLRAVEEARNRGLGGELGPRDGMGRSDELGTVPDARQTPGSAQTSRRRGRRAGRIRTARTEGSRGTRRLRGVEGRRSRGRSGWDRRHPTRWPGCRGGRGRRAQARRPRPTRRDRSLARKRWGPRRLRSTRANPADSSAVSDRRSRRRIARRGTDDAAHRRGTRDLARRTGSGRSNRGRGDGCHREVAQRTE